MTRRFLIYTAFVLSGAAGLVYEVVWSRYLSLYVGHSAYAQILVLAVYLGGMALGALAVGDASKRLANPLRWYAGAEGLLALAGLLFHVVFQLATDHTYQTVFPAVGDAAWVGIIRWGVSGLLILPQAIVLGTTFPLMAAGLVRRDLTRPGRGVASVYLANTLGGAAGILLAGFWLIARFGLPGTLAAAALLNVGAAGLVLWVLRSGRTAEGDGEADMPTPNALPPGADAPRPPPTPGAWAAHPKALLRMLLLVSFGTAVASFAYEIAWIRMLSLVLGSATHSFELMLSAFILGLALGAWLIREWTDRTDDPLRLLGGIQVVMGLAALATLPLYLASFEVMAGLVTSLRTQDGGYLAFNASRYALALAVMLPSTVMAGMTLPVITGSLLRAGSGEGAIGKVYGVNTIGSVVGAGAAGLVGISVLGLRGLLAAGAVVDIVLGIWLLGVSARLARRPRVVAVGAAVFSVVCVLVVLVAFPLDGALVTSGVFRDGEIRSADDWNLVYYRDGRTATVSAHKNRTDDFTILSTNGKPDASLEGRWLTSNRDTLEIEPIGQGTDFTTQALAPVVTLAHAPNARSAAVIGHGSGMSGTSLLSSETLERLVTIEIEPAMVEGSFAFHPANGIVFTDPRSSFVFDDAKSYFAARRERFDVIFAEPSNPWVSGVASLFTVEFYEQASRYLADNGVLGQWIQIYELNDDLFLSVVRALDAVFPSYRGYLVGDADVAIVASLDPEMPDPDWSVLELAGFLEILRSAPPFRPRHMEAVFLFDETTLRPILDRDGPVNSDFRPYLDARAERARFLGTSAVGVSTFGTSRIDIRRVLAGERSLPTPHQPVPARSLEPVVEWGRAAWIRDALREGGHIAPLPFPEWATDLQGLRDLLIQLQDDSPPTSWLQWAAAFNTLERQYHMGTTGWVDDDFYQRVYDYLDRASAPEDVRAAVDLLHGVGTWDWERAAAAADRLVAPVSLGEPWVEPQVLLDGAVLAYLKTGQPDEARRAYLQLRPLTGREDGHLRNRLLEALIDEALAS